MERKMIYVIKESDDGFESSVIADVFDNFELATAAIEELKTYAKFADNGKRYVMKSYPVSQTIRESGRPLGRPSYVYFGYTPDGDLYGDFSFMNTDPKWPEKMLVVDIPANFNYKHENDVFVVVKVPVYVNDNPEDVKDRGSEIANALLNKLKGDNMNINLLKTAGSGYLSANQFTRLPEIEFNSNKAFMLGVL